VARIAAQRSDNGELRISLGLRAWLTAKLADLELQSSTKIYSSIAAFRGSASLTTKCLQVAEAFGGVFSSLARRGIEQQSPLIAVFRDAVALQIKIPQ
jgi:hypothetical protein